MQRRKGRRRGRPRVPHPAAGGLCWRRPTRVSAHRAQGDGGRARIGT